MSKQNSSKNLKKNLEATNEFRIWVCDEMLDLWNVPQEVRYPQCEFLMNKSLIWYLESREFEGKRIHYIEVVKKKIIRRNKMKDKKLDVKLMDYLLGKEDLFDEVVDGLTKKIKEELEATDEDEEEEKNV